MANHVTVSGLNIEEVPDLTGKFNLNGANTLQLSCTTMRKPDSYGYVIVFAVDMAKYDKLLTDDAPVEDYAAAVCCIPLKSVYRVPPGTLDAQPYSLPFGFTLGDPC